MELTKYFDTVTDFRVKGRCLHSLADILGLILLGTIADCDDFTEIQDYGNDKIVFLQTELGFKFLNGIPCEDTLDRVMRHLDPLEIESSMRSCAGEILTNLSEKHICLGGKEHRGTISEGSKHALIRTVSAWIVDEKFSFGQSQIESKTNEKTAIPALLDILDITGSIITIDAIGCQVNIVEKIVNKNADYLIALKQNQGKLFEQVRDWMLLRKEQIAHYENINKEHGRGEQRKTYICQDLSFLDECQKWKGLNTLVMTESIRITKLKTTHSYRFYMSSLTDTNAQTYYKLSRDHWAIENHLHWQLDLTFKEDDSRIRKENAPLNMNIVRKLALYLLSKNTEKSSIKRKRKKAARDNDFIISILQNS